MRLQDCFRSVYGKKEDSSKALATNLKRSFLATAKQHKMPGKCAGCRRVGGAAVYHIGTPSEQTANAGSSDFQSLPSHPTSSPLSFGPSTPVMASPGPPAGVMSSPGGMSDFSVGLCQIRSYNRILKGGW